MCKQVGIDFLYFFSPFGTNREEERRDTRIVYTSNLRNAFNFPDDGDEAERSIHNEFVQFSIWNGFSSIDSVFLAMMILDRTNLSLRFWRLYSCDSSSILAWDTDTDMEWMPDGIILHMNRIEMDGNRLLLLLLCSSPFPSSSSSSSSALHRRWRFEKSIEPAMALLVRAHIE